MLGLSILLNRPVITEKLLLEKRDPSPIYTFLTNAEKQTTIEKSDILSLINKIEPFSDVLKQDTKLLRTNGILNERVKRNLSLLSEFYQNKDVEDLFGLAENSIEQIQNLERKLATLNVKLRISDMNSKKMKSKEFELEAEIERLKNLFAQNAPKPTKKIKDDFKKAYDQKIRAEKKVKKEKMLASDSHSRRLEELINIELEKEKLEEEKKNAAKIVKNLDLFNF